MVILFSVITFLFLNAAAVGRSRRAVWSINAMSKCMLGYPAYKYIGYGCWCGPGNADVEPVDEIDECCMLHDKCYEEAVKLKICFLTPSEYAHAYNFACDNNNLTCLESSNDCSTTLCQCDMDLVKCWSNLPKLESKKLCPQSRTFTSQLKDFLSYIGKEIWALIKEWGGKIATALGLHLIAGIAG